MNNVALKSYNAAKIDFVNSLEGGAKIQFTNRYGYSVKYSNNNVCIGEITADMFDTENPDKFHINIIVRGVFEFKSDVEKEKIHVESFKELFPFAKSIVATVTTAAGVPPVMLPPFDIESQNIYRFGNN